MPSSTTVWSRATATLTSATSATTSSTTSTTLTSATAAAAGTSPAAKTTVPVTQPAAIPVTPTGTTCATATQPAAAEPASVPSAAATAAEPAAAAKSREPELWRGPANLNWKHSRAARRHGVPWAKGRRVRISLNVRKRVANHVWTCQLAFYHCEQWRNLHGTPSPASAGKVHLARQRRIHLGSFHHDYHVHRWVPESDHLAAGVRSAIRGCTHRSLRRRPNEIASRQPRLGHASRGTSWFRDQRPAPRRGNAHAHCDAHVARCCRKQARVCGKKRGDLFRLAQVPAAAAAVSTGEAAKPTSLTTTIAELAIPAELATSAVAAAAAADRS